MDDKVAQFININNENIFVQQGYNKDPIEVDPQYVKYNRL